MSQHQPHRRPSRCKNNTQVNLDASILIDGRLQKAQLVMLELLEAVDMICRKHGLDYWLDRGSLLGAVRHSGFIPWDDDVDISMPRASYERFIHIAQQELPSTMWLQTCHTDPGYFNFAAPLKIRDCQSRFIEKHEQGTELYQQGIFIDVFPYDNMPDKKRLRKSYKFIGKKLLRLLRPKYTQVKMGHHPKLYEIVSQFISKNWLEKVMQNIIQKANCKNTSFVGYGFDSTKTIYLSRDTIYPLKTLDFAGKQFNVPHKYDEMLKAIYGDYNQLPLMENRKPNHCRELVLGFKSYSSDIDS